MLPILPALAASSPLVEGRLTGLLDNRMEFYRTNSRRIPSICGLVVPEPIFTPEAYEREILQRIYRDLAPFDPEGILQDEFANARGAIARFERGSIEIRVLDIQECPAADLAVCQTAATVLRAAGRRAVLGADAPGVNGDRALGGDLPGHDPRRRPGGDPAGRLPGPVRFAGGRAVRPASFGTTWSRQPISSPTAVRRPGRGPCGRSSRDGPLARRLVGRLADDRSPQHVTAVYRELCNCLESGRMFPAANC